MAFLNYVWLYVIKYKNILTWLQSRYATLTVSSSFLFCILSTTVGWHKYLFSYISSRHWSPNDKGRIKTNLLHSLTPISHMNCRAKSGDWHLCGQLPWWHFHWLAHQAYWSLKTATLYSLGAFLSQDVSNISFCRVISFLLLHFLYSFIDPNIQRFPFGNSSRFPSVSAYKVQHSFVCRIIC